MGLHEGGSQHQGTPKMEGPSDNQQSTRNGVTERKKRMKRLVEAAGTQTMTMVKQNEANRRKQSTIPSKNDNQPDRNGGDLLCDGRQSLSAALDPLNPTKFVCIGFKIQQTKDLVPSDQICINLIAV
jgi:hypothetical protein